ncbi:aspartate carbamoyltransferase [Candidatus Peregrinibacteria bacterium]|jgi:aspartate carbamoyltransferase catalytic subunit|nr:aspartate carbamoyltransferase [Candidatus Peregrinibacteria bacterium]MBT7736722.1 aspartate carbamoyltransferase [Candidatus Peregrinibacteria bacterium]
MNFQGQHILSTAQFDSEGMLSLFEEAKKMEKIMIDGGSDILDGKILATLFFEPSTRTRFSFESAMNRLGGRVISNADMMATSSLKKKESLEDTAKTVSQMVDVIVMRHPESGSVDKMAQNSDVPVINAGDGPNQHPTQALLDVYTVWKERGGLDGVTIGMVGDLRNGRVPHSQCDLLKHFNVKFVLVSPDELAMPSDIVSELKHFNCEVVESNDLVKSLPEMDVIGMTRVQMERFESEEEYKKYEGVYVLDPELMKKAKEDAIILHPLPRVDEIAVELDSDPRSKYFEQVGNGVAIRMALLKKVLE